MWRTSSLGRLRRSTRSEQYEEDKKTEEDEEVEKSLGNT